MIIKEIDINKIKPAADNARKLFEGINELAESINQDGLINPLEVKVISRGYEIISGERRYRAIKKLNWKYIPCSIVETDNPAIRSMIENIQREDLNSMELAEGIRLLIKQFNYNNSQIAKRLSKGRKYIIDHLALLKLPGKLKDSVRLRTVSYTIAIELSKIKNTSARNKALTRVIKGDIDRGEIRELAKQTTPGRGEIRELANQITPGKVPGGSSKKIDKKTDVFNDIDFNSKPKSRILIEIGKLKILWG
jgi:ParB family chromosome partitioning protein